MTDIKVLLKENEELKAELFRIKNLPEYEVFLGMLVQIGVWNAEMKDKPVSIKSGTEEDTRAFDKMIKYMDQRSKLYADLDSMRQKLSPDLVKKAEKESTSLIDDVRKDILKSHKESIDA